MIFPRINAEPLPEKSAHRAEYLRQSKPTHGKIVGWEDFAGKIPPKKAKSTACDDRDHRDCDRRTIARMKFALIQLDENTFGDYALHNKVIGSGAIAMELREALNQIAEIRLRMTESELFHGYRALPVAASGLLAFAGGWLQPLIVPDPMHEVRAFVLFWSSVALLSVVAAGLTMGLRDCFAGPSHTRALTWIALRQFVPCLFGGAVITMAIMRFAPDAGWLLPGLWQLFFAQGVFASCRILPRPVYCVSAFHLLAGSLNLLYFHDDCALSPWTMALPFGVGQLLAASILYWTLERRDAFETES